MSEPAGPARGTGLVAALLVVSGAAALLHETAWFRLLVPLVGAGALPGALVAAGALAGLAAGSLLGGALADRASRPALVLAGAECLAALVGRLVPGVLDRAPSLAATVGCLALAAVPWGMTVPAAVRTVVPSPDRTARTFARLYAWNTAGAVLGIAFGAAWLFEALGSRRTIDVACAAEAAVGVLAAVVAFATPRRAPATASASFTPPPVPARRLLPFAFGAAVAGAAGVGTQVAWTRRLTPVLGATFSAFAAVLAIHLVGIALGSACLGPRRARRPRAALATLAVLAAAATAGTPFFLAAVVERARAPWWSAYGDPFAMLGLRAAITAALVLPAVVTGAALLPWIVERFAPRARHEGRGVGTILAANALGAAIGGLAVATVLVPRAGTLGSLVACAGASLVAGACALGRRAGLLFASVGLALAATPFVARLDDDAATSSVGALYSLSAYRPADVVPVLAREGTNASVLVRDREGRLEFWVEGSFEASTGPTDRLHLGLLGHLPLALFAARSDRAARVAIVGLGGGLTAQAASRHRPARLDVYELEPEVVAAAERFRSAGGGLPLGARLTIGDGRRAILEGHEPLDVVSSDPIHPAIAGSAFLYTSEYWRGATRRLGDGGVLVQWLPLYQIHVDELKLALRTFAASVPFPYVFLAGSDALLVGSRTPLSLSEARLGRLLASDRGGDLRSLGFSAPGRLLGLLALDPAGCRALAGAGEVDTDDRLLLERRCGWREPDDESRAYALFRSIPADPRSLLDGAPSAAFALDLAWAERFERAMAAWIRWDLPVARRRFTALADEDADDAFARRMRDEATAELARSTLAVGDVDRAVALARELTRPDVEPTLVLDAAEVLLRAGEEEEARAVAARVSASSPAASRWPRARRIANGR